MKKPYYKRLSTWLPLILGAGIALGIWIGSYFFSRKPIGSDSAYDKLQTIMYNIEKNYVDSVDLDSLLEQSLPGLMSLLDPHSTYIPASELEMYNDDISGSFSGIGIKFNVLTDTIAVDEVISGGPSEKVGILAGDRIIEIDDSVVAGRNWSNERIIKSLRGPKDTTVKLGIKRANSDDLLTYTVTRGDIPVNSVDASYIISDGIGYVKLSKFTEESYKEFLTALARLRTQGATKYIIDLRGNGGGLMQAAVRMANEFLQMESTIVSMKGRNEQYDQAFYSDGLGSFKDEELVVLIDESSASASEILAGAIQDNDRGTIIGRRSFGKGLVQNQMELPGNSAMRLTVARYYTPSGRCIQKSYTPGNIDQYQSELLNRFTNGEIYSADSMHIDKSQIFHTVGGREVYGGGGIVPDIYVPNDTIGISDYYIRVFNAGMLQKFSFSYSDKNRTEFSKAKNVEQLLKMLPSDDALLNDFVYYASHIGRITPRWYYINQSRQLIVSILKALIARDVLGTAAYYEVINQTDTTVARAIEELNK